MNLATVQKWWWLSDALHTYVVSSTGSFIDESFKFVLGFYLSSCPRWDWDGPDICSQYSINTPTLLKKTHICNVSRGLWGTIWCHYTSDHAQPHSERARRFFQGRPHQCGLRQCSVIGSLLIYAHESTAETVRQLSYSGTDMLSWCSLHPHDRWVRYLAHDRSRDVESWSFLGQHYFRSGFTSLYFTCSWTLSNMALMSISPSTLYVQGCSFAVDSQIDLACDNERYLFFSGAAQRE